MIFRWRLSEMLTYFEPHQTHKVNKGIRKQCDEGISFLLYFYFDMMNKMKLWHARDLST